MMTILHIISDMDPKTGGVSQAVRTLINGLSELGTASAVVCLNEPASNFLAQSDFPIFGLGRGFTAWNIKAGLSRWLKSNIQRYDGVILHGLWQYQSYALLKNIRFSDKTRILIMPHGMLDPYFQRAPDRKFKAIRNLFFWHLIERHILKKAGGILFTCETEKLLAKDTFRGYAPQQEIVVGLGIEPPPPYDKSLVSGFLARFPQLAASGGYLLYISRIHPKKGLDNLINAYLTLKLHKKMTLPPLVVAGPGLDTDYGRAMKQLAAVEPGIIFTGMLVGSLKWGAFYGCQAFILPSHQENFGIAVVEALACGKPVLISDQVNIWREIGQKGAGLVSKDHLDGTMALLRRWLQLSAAEQTEMAEAALQTYRQYFTVDVAAARLKNVLDQAYADKQKQL